MKKVALLSLLLAGCINTPVINQANLQDVNFYDLLHKKTNKACRTLILGILPIERMASIAEAAWQAGIEKVSYVETSWIYAWPLVLQECVIIYGE